MTVTVGSLVTFKAWGPASLVGKVVDQDHDDPAFYKVRCRRDGKERWYHQDSLQPHVPPPHPWEVVPKLEVE